MAVDNQTTDPSVSLIRGDTRKHQVPYRNSGNKYFPVDDVRTWFGRQRDAQRRKNARLTVFQHFARHLPILGWLSTYKPKEYLLWDVLAGASVGALVVPQGMAYATLAGLPQVWGLYGAFVPVLCYAALGSSRHLAVGPVAVTSLYLGSALKKLAPPGSEEYGRAAIQVAFLAGVMYSAVGIFRLGFVTNFLSHSVISGFTTGASVLIALSQAKQLFGYDKYNPGGKVLLPSQKPAFGPALPPVYAPAPDVKYPSGGNDPIQDTLKLLLSHQWLPHFRWREFLMGVCWLVLLFGCKEVGKSRRSLVYIKASGPLLVVVLSISIVSIFRLYDKPHGILTVGPIPKGLPHETVSWWFPMPNASTIALTAVVVCLIDILESISIAKALAYKNNYVLDPTQELRGLGLANVVGSMFNCYTTTGSFSRSAIMDSVGARTQLAGIISGLIVMVVLLFLTPLFKNMPKNAQSAIIISAVLGLFNWQEWWFLFKVNKLDFVVFNIAALFTMFLGVELGLAISIGASIVLVLWKSAFPHTAVLGQLPETTVYRNVKQYPDAATIDGVLLARIDAPLYFANVNPVRDALEKYEERAQAQAASVDKTLSYIAIDLSPVTDVDGSAIHFLAAWIRDHAKKGITIVLANPSTHVLRCLEMGNIPDLLGRDNIVVRMQDAVSLIKERLAEAGGPSKPEKDELPSSESSPAADPDTNGSIRNGTDFEAHPDLAKRSAPRDKTY